MCQYSSDDGHANDWHVVHLGSRAAGGAGVIFVEATAVEPRGRITPADAGLWDDSHVAPLQQITRYMRQQGTTPAIQLAHAGRKASCARPWEGGAQLELGSGGWETIGPSPIAFGGGALPRPPREADASDLQEIVSAFRSAAKRSLAAGFEMIELHAAHGYLLHSFHSPLSNHRADEYGGTFDNRTRLTIEVVRAMRSVWPEHLPMSVRLSCTDWTDGGWTLEESVELSRRLKREGVDLIDCSSGFVVPGVKYPFGAGWQAPLAETIRKQADVPTAAVGLITDPAQADEMIRNGRADIVLLARESLRNPYWPIDAARQLGYTEAKLKPTQYGHWV
jgi:2,4-dienoyl-CoA reductase-like NADH-dependent reductase (Old Yellow Enzyme family)